jgi:hypothetical protein
MSSFSQKDFFDLRATSLLPEQEVERSSPRSQVAIEDTIDALECLCVGSYPVARRPPTTVAAIVPPDELSTVRNLPAAE